MPAERLDLGIWPLNSFWCCCCSRFRIFPRASTPGADHEGP